MPRFQSPGARRRWLGRLSGVCILLFPAGAGGLGDGADRSPWQLLEVVSLPEELRAPVALGADPLGRLLVIDGTTSLVWPLERRKPASERAAAGVRPFGPSDQGGSLRLESPTRVFARWGLHVYTLDPLRRRVSFFDLLLRYESSFDLEAALLEGGGPRDAEIADFVVDKAGGLVVLDRLGGRVLLFDSAGRYRGSLGEDLTGPERLVVPSDLDIDPDGNVFVADPPKGRVVQISRQGNVRHVWSLRDRAHPRSRPSALAHAGRWLFVADPGEGRLVVLEPGRRQWQEYPARWAAPIARDATETRGASVKMSETVTPWPLASTSFADLASTPGGELILLDRAGRRVYVVGHRPPARP